MALIELDDLELTFRVPKPGTASLFQRVRRLSLHGEMLEVHALAGVTLRIADGERVGIVGCNGAGKSTLLRVLADIYEPTAGRRLVEGRISSLFEISLGFEVDATGWENIAYRSFLQGESRHQVRAKAAAIAEFCELGRHLDMPVRYYSAGMKVRLAFAVATAIEPDILLVDEAFSAGDAQFRARAHERLAHLLTKARIVVAVSHEPEILLELCDRLLWLESGRIRMDGPAREVLDAYLATPTSHFPTAAAA